MAGEKMPKEQATMHHLDEFDGLDMLEARYYRQRFPRHVHETFCIGVIEEGAQRFWRSGGEHVAPAGDIILVNADEVHTGCADVENGWAYRAIYPDPELLRQLTRDLKHENGIIPWFPQAVVHDPGLSAQLQLVFNMLPVEGNSLLKEPLLLTAISWLIIRYSRTPITPAALPCSRSMILQVRDLMMSYPEKNWSLKQLSDVVQLSPWHFLRQFKQTVGMTPHAWLVQARLRKAREMLLQGVTITAVAARCGFSDQSHFTRHFKNSMGVTPGEFIRSLRSAC